MKRLEPLVFKLCLAILPVLPTVFDGRYALFIGMLVGLALMVTAVVFSYLPPLFPPRLQGFSILLWLTCLAQVAFYAFAQNPLWAVSVYVLLGLEPGPETQPPKLTHLLLLSLGFAFLLMSLGFARQYLGGWLHVILFQQAAGDFLILGFVMILARLLSLDKGES